MNDKMNKLKNKMLEFIAKPIPQTPNIVKQSVPLLFFGNIENASHAIFYINPSNKEMTNP
jgi:hypothetical protein